MMGAMNCDEIVRVIEDGVFHEARWSRVMEQSVKWVVWVRRVMSEVG